MKLGDVLRKERNRKKLTEEDIAKGLRLSADAYRVFESGDSSIEEWGPKLAEIAIKLSTPTSRFISETGKFMQSQQESGQCGKLIRTHRERRGFSKEELAMQLGWPVEQLSVIENGESPLEEYGPVLLGFAEMVNQPIFNLFYPCGLPFTDLNDYP